LDWFGFQIYAAIDAYSRYITWIYVGTTAHTAVSVLKQYLDTIEELGIHPQRLRSDRGTETPMVADAHYQIALKLRTSVSLNDCFFFGTSVANQRIESWWGQITKGALYRWRVRLYTLCAMNILISRQLYFEKLEQEGLWSKGSLADRISLIAIYMPIIRSDVQSFVHNWNIHKIRKQKNRPNGVFGQPIKLYNWPGEGVRNYGTPVPKEMLQPFQAELEGFGEF